MTLTLTILQRMSGLALPLPRKSVEADCELQSLKNYTNRYKTLVNGNIVNGRRWELRNDTPLISVNEAVYRNHLTHGNSMHESFNMRVMPGLTYGPHSSDAIEEYSEETSLSWCGDEHMKSPHYDRSTHHLETITARHFKYFLDCTGEINHSRILTPRYEGPAPELHFQMQTFTDCCNLQGYIQAKDIDIFGANGLRSVGQFI